MTIKKEYERPQSWAIDMDENIMGIDNVSITPDDGKDKPFHAPRYQGDDDWDE